MEPKQQPPYPLRMPTEMRAHYEDLAQASKRSLNAEIVAALEETQSLRKMVESLAAELQELRAASVRVGQIPVQLHGELAQWAAHRRMSMTEALEQVIYAGMDKNAPEVLVLNVAPGVTSEVVAKALAAAAETMHPYTALHLNTNVAMGGDVGSDEAIEDKVIIPMKQPKVPNRGPERSPNARKPKA